MLGRDVFCSPSVGMCLNPLEQVWHVFESIGAGVVDTVLLMVRTSNTHFEEDPKADF